MINPQALPCDIWSILDEGLQRHRKDGFNRGPGTQTVRSNGHLGHPNSLNWLDTIMYQTSDEEPLALVNFSSEVIQLAYLKHMVAHPRPYRPYTIDAVGPSDHIHDTPDMPVHTVKSNMPHGYLHTVQDERTFRGCFRDIFKAHYMIYNTAGIIHQDISTSNLMVDAGHSGQDLGVLVDWDLASTNASEYRDHTRTRTGTRAFMAAELFDQYTPEHILRFDWESFLCYLMWVVFVLVSEEYKKAEIQRIMDETKGRGKVDDVGSRMARWLDLSDDALSRDKESLMSAWSKRPGKQTVYKFHSTFSIWVDPMWKLFIAGHETRNNGDPRYETLGDRLTYESLCGILDREPEAR